MCSVATLATPLIYFTLMTWGRAIKKEKAIKSEAQSSRQYFLRIKRHKYLWEIRLFCCGWVLIDSVTVVWWGKKRFSCFRRLGSTFLSHSDHNAEASLFHSLSFSLSFFFFLSFDKPKYRNTNLMFWVCKSFKVTIYSLLLYKPLVVNDLSFHFLHVCWFPLGFPVSSHC